MLCDEMEPLEERIKAYIPKKPKLMNKASEKLGQEFIQIKNKLKAANSLKL